MKKLLFLIILSISFICFNSFIYDESHTIGIGQQTQVSIDTKGIVRVVFGSDDKIFCATSKDHGRTFSKPVLVAQVPDMHLDMSRGPQLISSATYSVITVKDKAGNIHWYKLNQAIEQCKPMGVVNDLKESAPEGLMSIAADQKDNFYAVWLDIRTGKHNQIYFSSLSGTAKKMVEKYLSLSVT